MDMNLREWLIIAGIVIILGIIIDGYRRVRRARKDSLEMSLGMGGGIENTPLDTAFGAELPNGGARVIRPATSPDLEKPAIYPSRPTNTGSRVVMAEAVAPAPSTTVATVTSSHEVDEHLETDTFTGDSDVQMENHLWGESDTESIDAWGSSQEPDWDDSFSESSYDEPDDESIHETELDDSKPEPVDVVAEPAISKKTGNVSNVHEISEKPTEKEKGKRFGGLFGNKSFSGWTKPSKQEKKPEPKGPTEVIVINVMSKSEHGFSGHDLRTLFEACGMEHGEMAIFHRHEDISNTSPIQFSVANAVEPGYFDTENIDSSTTPGVSFFISLPGPSNSIQAFDYMVETAQCLVRNLHGELKDERRSIMTPQTIGHFRERVRDFERKRLSFRK